MREGGETKRVAAVKRTPLTGASGYRSKSFPVAASSADIRGSPGKLARGAIKLPLDDSRRGHDRRDRTDDGVAGKLRELDLRRSAFGTFCSAIQDTFPGVDLPQPLQSRFHFRFGYEHMAMGARMRIVKP